MNEYQDALNALKNSNIKLYVYKDQDNVIEENQPSIFDFYHSEIFVLQKLIDKVTPTKPYCKDVDEPLCPYCHNPLDGSEAHCEICDQRIDWSSI
ncbi:hypothetical protein [Beduini massiliensis]|uniref:hypothetical protein n=1 Tax=Beduini massiliensis TaxID=1585974 RepID=UPI00059AB11B|nr:hypothetical protein [Beduini massiliensis]